ncbi:MAG: hypothetical protein JW913_19380 [Chitinispirillaceae bacterium]|nr:hypothetical protein [Chitinispirillaceae bacterium]
MTSKRIFIFATILTALSQPVLSQSVLGLLYPMGISLRSASGPSLSLCGTGVGIGNDFFGLTNNPANLGVSGRTTFSSAVSGELLTVDDGTAGSRHLDLNLRLFSLTIPIGAFGALGVSFEPYSTANMRFRLLQEIDIDGMFADTAELGIISSGGAIAWQVGWGYTIRKAMRVGIAYRRFNFNRSMTKITRMRGSLHDRLLDSSKTSFATNGIRVGVQVPVQKLTIGLSGDYFFINKARTDRVITGTRDTLDLTTSDRYDFKPPPSLAAGLSWRFNPRWLAACDIGATLWERFYSEIEPQQTLHDAWYVSGGVQFIPAPDLLTPKLYEITHYRAGLRCMLLPETDGTEMAATIAVGLPMQSNGALFDIIFEYAQRRDRRFESYRENMFSLKLGINGARKWYQSSDENY